MAGPASVNASVYAFNDDMYDALCHSLSQTQHILKTISSFKGNTPSNGGTVEAHSNQSAKSSSTNSGTGTVSVAGSQVYADTSIEHGSHTQQWEQSLCWNNLYTCTI